MEAAWRLDARAREDLESYPVGTTFALHPWPTSPPVRLVRGRRRFGLDPNPSGPADYRFVFKSLAAVFPVLLGRRSVGDAYLQNRMTVAGDLMTVMPFMRAVDRTEAALFPSFLIRGLFPEPIGDVPRTLRFLWHTVLVLAMLPFRRRSDEPT